MWLSIVIVKGVIELSLMFILGRFVLGLLIGSRRTGNIFWQVLDIAASPTLRLTRSVSPKVVLDRHIPLATTVWLLVVWVVVIKLKIDACLEAGMSTCK